MEKWHKSADRFAELADGAGPDLAVLVAMGVTTTGEPGKGTIAAFALRASASPDRISRHRKAWGLAHNAGLVPASTELSPDSEYVLSEELRAAWKGFYRDALGRDFPAERHVAAVNADPAKVVAAMKPEQRQAIVTEILRTAEKSEIRQVQQAAQARHEEEHADGYAKARAAEARLQEERRERIGLRMLDVDSHLIRAKAELRKAVDLLRDERIVEAYVDQAKHRIDDLQQLVNLARVAIGAESSVDWDAELAKIGADS